MGIFSDRCEALIDKTSGLALSGQALEAARQDQDWPRCGNKVSKKARSCSKCGAGAPKGWWRCPHCDKWVGNESNFCWNCHARLNPDTRMDLAGGVWQKPAGVFAQRFEISEVKRLLDGGLEVQAGTLAILLDAGKVSGTLGPGRHTPDGVLRRINWFNNPPPRSAIMADSADVIIPVRLQGLRSAENITVDTLAEVIVRLDQKNVAAFVENLFQRRARSNQLTYEDLSEHFASEMRGIVKDFCTKTTMDDLFRDPLRRVRLDDDIAAQLQVALERAGLELIRVSSAEFGGANYDALLKQAEEVEVKRRSLEFDQRMRELLTSDKMQELMQENRLDDYVAQLAQEKGVKDEHRKHELDRLKQVHRHELERAEALHQMQAEMDEAGHQIGIKLKWVDFENEELVRRTKAQVEAGKMAMELDELANKQEAEQLERMARIFQGKKIEELLPLIKDQAVRNQLMELELKKGASPEYLLALAAERSPQAAEALARMAGMRKEELLKVAEEYKTLYRESRERDERVTTHALDAAKEAAKRGGSSTTINK